MILDSHVISVERGRYASAQRTRFAIITVIKYMMSIVWILGPQSPSREPSIDSLIHSYRPAYAGFLMDVHTTCIVRNYRVDSYVGLSIAL
jgi:hypothetical protein